MPKAANLILVCTPDLKGADEVETAILGSHVERWDTHPKRGKRVAHGRCEDGFWQSKQMNESQLVGWFWLAPMHAEYQGKMWIRDDCRHPTSVIDLAEDLFAIKLNLR